MSTTKRAMIVFPPDHFEKSKISAETVLPLQNRSGSRGPFIRTEDRTEPQEFQTGSALSRNVGTALSREGYFATLLNALHESRRLQAARVFHQYRHLIAKDRSFKSPDNFSEREIPSGGKLDLATGDYPRVQRPAKSKSLNTWILITTVVAFGILHVVGGIILFNDSGARPTATSLVAIRGD